MLEDDNLTLQWRQCWKVLLEVGDVGFPFFNVEQGYSPHDMKPIPFPVGVFDLLGAINLELTIPFWVVGVSHDDIGTLFCSFLLKEVQKIVHDVTLLLRGDGIGGFRHWAGQFMVMVGVVTPLIGVKLRKGVGDMKGGWEMLNQS